MILTSRGGPDCATTSSDAGLPITPWRVSGDVPTTTVPGSPSNLSVNGVSSDCGPRQAMVSPALTRSEEHTSELQSLMRISYAVFCLNKKKNQTHVTSTPSQYYKHNTI